ncbi:MAG: sn-glycerol-1-phosphate dehydrogenase [Oscillospiraceae bacterium]|nr:sn-glycerol-1-phosphate dehydrogenase [Oscillospiraceae bacterium]
MAINKMHAMNGVLCSCGKVHSFSADILTGKGVLNRLPSCIEKLGAAKAFVLSDKNTYAAAGTAVCDVLENASVPYTSYSFPDDTVEPDEKSVGAAFMHYDTKCDVIIGVGSGVINDISKIVSNITGKPYIIVGTAPSMDGYASATSSMTRDGLKVSLPSRSADVIIADADILCNAPMHMMKSGLGDMLAKYVSICEWRISHLINGEYYCEEVASLIRSALARCVENWQGLLNRDETAVMAVFEGLVIGGVAMNYAGLSRPASGCEHYISHIIDMRAVEFGTPMDLHGIQCAIGTLIAARLYEKLKSITPDREKALAYAEKFDFAAWSEQLRKLLGKGAEAMIAQESKERKYDIELHKARLEVILSNWEEILKIIDEELPSSAELESLLTAIDAPCSLSDIGIDEDLLPSFFAATKDIRDKYVLSRLAWDLGVLDELLS